MKSQKNEYRIFSDGAYSSKLDQGGVGILVLKGDKEILRYSKMYKHVTNNKMELGAVIIALRMIKGKIDSLTIYTDSMYVLGCATLGWKRKKNALLWEEFDKQHQRVKELCPKIDFVHVKGHAGNKYNEIVDDLAVKASQEI